MPVIPAPQPESSGGVGSQVFDDPEDEYDPIGSAAYNGDAGQDN